MFVDGIKLAFNAMQRLKKGDIYVSALTRIHLFVHRPVALKSLEIFKQKLAYIQYNPLVAGLCGLPEEYKYSTARFYETGINNSVFISHYTE